MTRERLEQIKEEFRFVLATTDSRSITSSVESALRMFDETIAALETAWAEQAEWSRRAYAAEKERDEARGQRDTCSLELEAAINERDDAIMEGMALVQEKDGMQIEIDRLRAESAVKDQGEKGKQP